MKTLNKLVRDNIVEIIKERGGECTHHVADWREYETRLKDKLYEETEEFFEEPCKEEMADIQEVLEALMAFYSIDPYEMETAKLDKRGTRGGFMNRVVLDTVGK